MGATMIPKIIHQVWVKGTERPAITLDWSAKLQTINPGWEYRLHEVDPVSGFKASHVSNAVRMSVLFVFGGVYLDCDVEPIHPLDEMGFDSDKLNCDGYLNAPHYAVLAVSSEHPAVDYLSHEFLSKIQEKTVPNFFTTFRRYCMAHPGEFNILPNVTSFPAPVETSTALYHHLLTTARAK
jgi:heat shock protein HspQ